jgi:integrase
MVDLQLTPETAKTHRQKIRRFLVWLNNNRDGRINSDNVRAYLSQFNCGNPFTYANTLKSLKVFCRDFLKQPQVVESFKFPTIPFTPKKVPSQSEIVTFYNAIDGWKWKSLFLLYCTSGLRRQEVLNLHITDIDLEKCLVKPKPHNGRTKHTWISFFNSECANALKCYLSERTDNNPKLFPMSRIDSENLWQTAKIKTGLNITPQMLREYFCSQLDAPDRYIDAFCGRLPKSVLARHYSDFSPEKLSAIYKKANLVVLNTTTEQPQTPKQILVAT